MTMTMKRMTMPFRKKVDSFPPHVVFLLILVFQLFRFFIANPSQEKASKMFDSESENEEEKGRRFKHIFFRKYVKFTAIQCCHETYCSFFSLLQQQQASLSTVVATCLVKLVLKPAALYFSISTCDYIVVRPTLRNMKLCIHHSACQFVSSIILFFCRG